MSSMCTACMMPVYHRGALPWLLLAGLHVPCLADPPLLLLLLLLQVTPAATSSPKPSCLPTT